MKTFKDIIEESTELNEGKKIGYDEANVATLDAMLSLKRRDWKVVKTSENSISLYHDNGCIGHLVFDPTFKK